MTAAPELTTQMSPEGQVTLPQSIRQRRGWRAGVRLVVEETEVGVLLKPAPLFAPTQPGDVYGSLKTQAPPKSLEAMYAAAQADVRRFRGKLPWGGNLDAMRTDDDSAR